MSVTYISAFEIIKGNRGDGKPIYHAVVKSADSNFRGNDGSPVTETLVTLPMSEMRIKSFLLNLLNDYEAGQTKSSNGSPANPIAKAYAMNEKLNNPHVLSVDGGALKDIAEAAYALAIKMGIAGYSPVFKGWDGKIDDFVLPDDADFASNAQRWDFVAQMLPHLKEKGLHQVYPEDLVLHGALKNDLDILTVGALMSDNPIRFLAETEVSISKDGFSHSSSGQTYPALITEAGRNFLFNYMKTASDSDLKLVASALMEPLFSLSAVQRDIPYENFMRTVTGNMVDISQKAYETLKNSGRTAMLAEFDTVLRAYRKVQEQLDKGQLILSESESIALVDEIKESIRKDYPDVKPFVAHYLKSAIYRAFRDESFSTNGSLLEKPMIDIALRKIQDNGLSPTITKRDAVRTYVNALRLGAVRHLISEEDYQSALKSLEKFRNAMPGGVKRALVESGIEVAKGSISIEEEAVMSTESADKHAQGPDADGKSPKGKHAIVLKFIEKIKQSEGAGFDKPWKPVKLPGGIARLPHNAVTGNVYSGFNYMMTSMSLHATGYADPRFLTFKQAKKIGAHIKKGSTALALSKPIIIPESEAETSVVKTGKDFVEAVVKENQSNDASAKEATDEDADVTQRKKVTTGKLIGVRPFYVFHVSDIDREKSPDLPPEFLPIDDNESIFVDVDENTDRSFLQKIVEHIKDMGLNVEEGGSEAFYIRGTKNIRIPKLERFKGESEFVRTILHETVHATKGLGLEREFMGRLEQLAEKRGWASDYKDKVSYAIEEIVAETGADALATSLNISAGQENSRAYLYNWLIKALGDTYGNTGENPFNIYGEEESRILFSALSDANKAVQAFMKDAEYLVEMRSQQLESLSNSAIADLDEAIAVIEESAQLPTADGTTPVVSGDKISQVIDESLAQEVVERPEPKEPKSGDFF